MSAHSGTQDFLGTPNSLLSQLFPNQPCYMMNVYIYQCSKWKHISVDTLLKCETRIYLQKIENDKWV
jgi:hypothetical protein